MIDNRCDWNVVINCPLNATRVVTDDVITTKQVTALTRLNGLTCYLSAIKNAISANVCTTEQNYLTSVNNLQKSPLLVTKINMASLKGDSSSCCSNTTIRPLIDLRKTTATRCR